MGGRPTGADAALVAAALTVACALSAAPTAKADPEYRKDHMHYLAEAGERSVTDYLTQIGIAPGSLPALTFSQPSGVHSTGSNRLLRPNVRKSFS